MPSPVVPRGVIAHHVHQQKIIMRLVRRCCVRMLGVGNFAPVAPGAFCGGLRHSVAPGASGGTVAALSGARCVRRHGCIHTDIWMVVATEPYLPCFQTLHTTPSHLLIHHSFLSHPEYPMKTSPYRILIPGKGVALAKIIGLVWALSEKATILLILILR